MKNHKIGVISILLAGLMLFASCKHEGFDVKKGSVQIPVVVGENSVNLSIPVDLYDVIAEKFTDIITVYNEDKLLSEEELKVFEDISYNIYNLNVFNASENAEDVKASLLKIADEKRAGKILKVLAKLTEPEQDELMKSLRGLSDYYDQPGKYLSNIAEIEAGESWYDSKDELLESMKADRLYNEFLAVMPQVFPAIVVNAK